MSDSLVIAGQIELLGAEGGVPSTIPACAGAIFTLAPDYDLSSPQTATDILSASLLDGERPARRRVGNRVMTIQVKITAPDRATLAAAREVLLELCDADTWPLTWTRDSGLPVIFDCFQALPAQPANQLFEEQELVVRLALSFPALPYGRSDAAVPVLFNAPSQVFDLPPSVVNIDTFLTASNFLTGNDTGFDTTIGNWVSNGNCTIARSTSQFHTTPASMALTASAAGNMQAASCAAASVTSLGLAVDPGDTVVVAGFSRAATVARSVNVGADFYDATGVFISTLRGSNATNSTSVFTTNPTASLTAPAGAAWARVAVQVVSAAGTGEIHYFDDLSINNGAVRSADEPAQWSLSSQTPTSGQKSAYWSRSWHDSPVYDHTMAASVDITGRDKLTFWSGLATTSSQWATWHQGSVTYAVTLYDAAGNSLSFNHKHWSQSSALPNKPHWQLITLPIPQTTSGFDYTTVSRYVVTAYNVWEAGYGATLQAGFYLATVQAAPSSTGTLLTRSGWFTIPGIVGSARAPFAVQAAPGPSSFSTVAEFTTAGSNNWTAPGGLTLIDKTETWGGGGGGAGSGSGHGGGGGGGGEYARRDNIPVTATSTYHPIVGAGGAHGGVGSGGSRGGDSSFTGNSGSSVTGHGGNPGFQSSATGGSRGASGSNDPIHYGGGDGWHANDQGQDIGGGGGASGGPNGSGTDATYRQGASAVPSGGPGGNGGYSSAQTPHNGSAPSSGPGGGGGGGNDGGAGFAGGDGFNGKVRLTYGASGITPLNSLLLHMPGRNAPAALNPVCPVGNGADTPNGATEYTVPVVGALNARFDGAYSLYLVASTWNSPSSSRNLTVVIKQYPYTGGTAASVTITRNGVTPTTDINNGFVDLGPVTLPLADLPAGQLNAYFTVAVTSSNTSDRFLDALFVDVTGQTVLVNVAGGASTLNNIWYDAPDQDRAIGGIFGSNADRDQAYSIAGNIERLSGGPLAVEPGQNNRLLAYSAQGAPAITGWYIPHWWFDRYDVLAQTS